MPLSREEIEKMDATYTSKFETVLSTQTNSSVMKIVLPDTFGAGGYVPYLMGAISAGREWVGSRLFKSLKTYGVRFTGKKYENTVEVQVDDINDDPALGASKIADAVAKTIPLHTEKQVIAVLASNAQGFDGAALFGDHTYSTEVGAPVYNNDITAAAGSEGPTWYVCNEKSVVVATRTGEDYTPQMLAGTDKEFTDDAVVFGWRARKIFAPGLWFDSVRSNKALTAENLEEALTRAAGFKNDIGEPVNNDMKFLVVPSSLESAANKVLKAMLVDGGNTNTMYNRLEIIVSKQLG